jgi:hypothetical protein
MILRLSQFECRRSADHRLVEVPIEMTRIYRAGRNMTNATGNLGASQLLVLP